MFRYLLLLVLVFSKPLFAIEVVLVNPTHDKEIFWKLVTTLSQEASKDLGVNLTVYYADSHRMVQSDLIDKIANQKNKPDYVIFMPYGGSILRSFSSLEKAKIPFVTLERVYDINRFPKLARPQENYKFWLGEVYMDNLRASKLLSDNLLKNAKTILGKVNNIRAVGVNGDYYAESRDRAEGLREITKDNNEVMINQIVSAQWSRAEAGKRFLKLHDRYGKADIIWAASDKMALGVLDVIDQTNLQPNHDFVLGGFDFLPEALRAIKANKMTASVGGHFLMGVWAVVKISDHSQGLHHVFEKGDGRALIEPLVIDGNNIDHYLPLINTADYGHINWAEFSLNYQENSANDYGYNLSVFEVMNKLKRAIK